MYRYEEGALTTGVVIDPPYKLVGLAAGLLALVADRYAAMTTLSKTAMLARENQVEHPSIGTGCDVEQELENVCHVQLFQTHRSWCGAGSKFIKQRTNEMPFWNF